MSSPPTPSFPLAALPYIPGTRVRLGRTKGDPQDVATDLACGWLTWRGIFVCSIPSGWPLCRLCGVAPDGGSRWLGGKHHAAAFDFRAIQVGVLKHAI